ncbi:MAG: class I SAM-dependent methyltransferase [Phycisphaerae bacterium]|nr:class I SAM-dependent methyltransferase [Phycisphaerae bacterium]
MPRGTSVLDWPCGRGHLLPLLKRFGYRVTCADSSSHAVAQARFYGGFLGESCIDDTDDFQFVDILQAGFDDDCFGAAIVNHLFCHFPESQMRQQVLKELARMCSGPIVVSFFRIVAVEKTVCYEHDGSCKHQMRDHVPVSRRSFAEEVSECGLIVEKWVPKHSLISKQACAVLVRDKGAIRPSRLP